MHTRLRPNRRAGISLIEAMIAIGILAIGLLSLLTLFPLGAIQIGQALKDDRCSETALQADAYIRSYWKYAVIGGGTIGGATDTNLRDPDAAGPLTDKFTDPDGSGTLFTAAGNTELSYPVVVDPIGYYSYAGNVNLQNFIAQNASGTPRVSTAGITSGNLAIHVASLPDDLSYDGDGQPTLSGPQLVRQGKYNWAAVLQRNPNSNTNEANLKILVFDGRPPLLNITSNEFALNVSTVTIQPGVTQSLTIASLPPSEVPLLRRGGWIMDGTNAGTIRHANFYRISAVNALGGGSFAVDLETPIIRTDSGTTAYTATFYLLVGLAEVFDRPKLTNN